MVSNGICEGSIRLLSSFEVLDLPEPCNPCRINPGLGMQKNKALVMICPTTNNKGTPGQISLYYLISGRDDLPRELALDYWTNED